MLRKYLFLCEVETGKSNYEGMGGNSVDPWIVPQQGEKTPPGILHAHNPMFQVKLARGELPPVSCMLM